MKALFRFLGVVGIAAVVTLTAALPAFAQGMGITQAEARQFFTDMKFNFQKGQPIKGQENWMGRATYTNVQILGDGNEVSEMTLMPIFSQDEKNNVTNLLQMAAFLGFAVPGWDDKMEWMVAAMKAQGAETTQGNRFIKLGFVKELGLVTLTVKPAE